MKFMSAEKKPGWVVYVSINSNPEIHSHSFSTRRPDFVIDENSHSLTEKGFIGFLFICKRGIKTLAGCSFSGKSDILRKKPSENSSTINFKREPSYFSKNGIGSIENDVRFYTDLDLDFPESMF